jgi:hypothetical protein
VPLVQNDHVVEQVSAHAPDPTLGDAVLPRTSEGCSDRQDPVVLHSRNDINVELRITVKDQESVLLVITPGLS